MLSDQSSRYQFSWGYIKRWIPTVDTLQSKNNSLLQQHRQSLLDLVNKSEPSMLFLTKQKCEKNTKEYFYFQIQH
jgi:hypothetical protein